MMWPRRSHWSAQEILALLAFLLSSCSFKNADAHLLSAYELAIQNWDLTLNCGNWKEGPELLFPLRKSAIEAGIEHDDSNSTNKFWRKKSITCDLSLFTNGTFALKPKDTFRAPTNTQVPPTSMPLRGKWMLRHNPYCITDRHYDELELACFPRVQRKISKSDGSQTEDQIMQEVRIKLKCRVKGRYSSSAIRNFCGYSQGKSMGRISCGTLLWDVVQSSTGEIPWWKRRQIGATFMGRPSSNQDVVLNEDIGN